jgi:hypothetical protein
MHYQSSTLKLTKYRVLPVCKKEITDVTKTMKHTTLPEGMALVETANGRWFAAYTSMSERILRVYLLEDPPFISPAFDSFYEGGTGYGCREEALAACHAWYETVELLRPYPKTSIFAKMS